MKDVVFLLMLFILFIWFIKRREGYTRIVCTLTTIPQRYKLLDKTLESLRRQKIAPTITYIHLAPKTLKGDNQDIEQLRKIATKYPNVTVNVIDKDLGPITKIVPLLPFIGTGDKVVIVDDDVTYDPKMISDLLKTKKPAVGYAGRRENLNYINGTTIKSPTTVDFLETFAGVMYDAEVLEGLAEYNATLVDTCMMQDDIKIGKFLELGGIERVVIPTKHFCHHDAEDTPQLYTDNSGKGNQTCYDTLWSNKFVFPKKLFQTYHTLENVPDYIHKNNKKFAPEYDITVLDDNAGLKFIKTYYQSDVVAKFNELTGPHKADLLRYCLLYVHGGVYMDIKTILTTDIDSFLDFSDLTSHRLYTVESIVENNIYQGFIATTQHNPIFLKLIQEVLSTSVDEIKNDYDILTKQMYQVVKGDGDVILFKEHCTGITTIKKDKYGYYCVCKNQTGDKLFDIRDPNYPY